VPSRARCGFAAYFDPQRKVDHRIVEVWSEGEQRWTRVDPEYLDVPTPVAAEAHDLLPGAFLNAGEAWQLVREGRADPACFGVFGTDNWGPGEIRGNAMRDLASVASKVEMLPWDEWGPTQASYEGRTGDEFDQLVDALAEVTADPDPTSVDLQRINDQLVVPAEMIG